MNTNKQLVASQVTSTVFPSSLSPPHLRAACQRMRGSWWQTSVPCKATFLSSVWSRLGLRWELMECEFLLRAHRQKEEWDNSPQLIHCTLKTHYFLSRKQKTCSPRWKEILCLRWRPWHSLPDFPHVCTFFYARFSRFDSSLLTGSFVTACQWAPAAPRTPTNLTAKCLNAWGTHSYRMCQKHSTGSSGTADNSYFTCAAWISYYPSMPTSSFLDFIV